MQSPPAVREDLRARAALEEMDPPVQPAAHLVQPAEFRKLVVRHTSEDCLVTIIRTASLKVILTQQEMRQRSAAPELRPAHRRVAATRATRSRALRALRAAVAVPEARRTAEDWSDTMLRL
jgi:hypothetical protein